MKGREKRLKPKKRAGVLDELEVALDRLSDDFEPVMAELEKFVGMAKKSKKRCYKHSWKTAKGVVAQLSTLSKKHRSLMKSNPDLSRSISLTVSLYDHYNGGQRVQYGGTSAKEMATDLINLYSELVSAIQSYRKG